MVKKVAFWSGGFITVILIVLAITCALFYKESISSSSNKKHSSILNQIYEHKELNVGMLRSLTSSYIDYSNPNQVGGFEVALLQKFADSLGVKLKITYTNTVKELLEKGRNGKIDLIAAELIGYVDEANTFIASQPFHYNTQQLIYRKGSVKPYSFNDITGDLTVAKNSLQSHILTNIKDNYSELQWNESNVFNSEELIRQVESQDIDYTIASNRTIAIMQRIYPLITVAFDVKKDSPKTWYLMNSSDKSLLNIINQFILESRENGTTKKLEYRYFSYMNKFDYVDIRAFINSIEASLPKYRQLFETYAETNKLDWKLLAAMSYQESHWNPQATSSTGVRGMMMLTQLTAESLGITDRLDPEDSIKGGSMYLKQIINRMPKSIIKEERIWFALAAYNMGTGHLWDARKLASKLGKNPDSWQDMRQILPLLSEEEYYTDLKYGFARGYQAVHFVESIQQYYISLISYLLEKNYQQNVSL